METRYKVILGFIAILALFSLISSRLFFETWAIELDDSTHYITSAKDIAGISISNIHNPHSFTYPLYLSLGLKLFSSLVSIKLLNILWLVLIGLLLYYETKNLKSFLIYAFSPIVYYSSIWIAPLTAVAFFILLSYFQIKKYNKTNSLKNLILSGFSLGIAISLWWGTIPYAIFFVLSFLLNKKLKELIYFKAAALVGISLALLIDYYYFNFPFYSLLRFIGAVAIVSLGKNPSNISFLHPLREQVVMRMLLMLVLISPLLFKIIKLNFKKYKSETAFLVLSSLFAIFYGADIKYFLPVFPLVLFLLNDVIKSKKDLKIHAALSILVVLIISYPFFFNNKEPVILKDFEEMQSEFNFTKIIAGDERKNSLASPPYLNSLYYKDKIWVIWGSDYDKLVLKNETVSTSYKLSITPKLHKARLMELSASMKLDKKQDLSTNYLVIDKNEQPYP
ncbi:hypothetical protein HYT58_02055, partial [Candidatus Woesearchaeota archaeon]|nr:hypothetical protein [Candidatus Woesearchaeota archaeon]